MSGAVDRWHGPTEEERVARGEAQAVRPRIGPAGAMVTFEDAFAPPEINRWLGGFLGAEPAGLGLQRLVFRASRSLAGGSDRMRLHCLRCLARYDDWQRRERVLALRDGPLGRFFVGALMARDNLSVDVASLGDLAPFGWHFPPRHGGQRPLATVRGSAVGDRAAEK